MIEQDEIQKIEAMPDEEIIDLWRFACIGHRYFDASGPFWSVIKKRLDKMNGFPTAIYDQMKLKFIPVPEMVKPKPDVKKIIHEKNSHPISSPKNRVSF